jgi:DnaK suppressor protein
MICTGVGIAKVLVGEMRDDIRRMLLEQRRELLSDIQSRVRDARKVGSNDHHSGDPQDTVEIETEDELAFALIQMKAETLERVTEAVHRFDEGTYGYCIDCDEIIASLRLRAMPFAVRCRDCEEMREVDQHRQRAYMKRVPSLLTRGTDG